MNGLRTHENRAMIILCLAGGVAALDAQALFYLSPFVTRDLAITNSQLGVLSAAVLVTWALSGFATSVLSDQLGRRKQYVIAAFVLFGLFSFMSGIAKSFLMLFAARLLIGVAEGPIVPLTQSIMMDESSPHRRGVNMGVVQSFGTQLVGSSLSPILLVYIATAFDWRRSFFIAGIPGFCIALIVAYFVREPQRIRKPTRPGGGLARAQLQVRDLLRHRNIRLCALLSVFLNAWYFGLLTFLPLFLVRLRHFAPTEMSYVMASAGIGAMVSAVVVPLLSDRFGRRPIMMVFAIVGAIGPLGALVPHASLVFIMTLIFLGSWAHGLLPLCIGTVPLESVPTRDTAACGLTMLVGMICGGIAGPGLFGYLADAFDLGVPLWACACAAAIAAIICIKLDETAPAIVRTSAARLQTTALH